MALDTILQEICSNKIGVEIGGPSGTGSRLYESSTRMDNVIFSNNPEEQTNPSIILTVP